MLGDARCSRLSHILWESILVYWRKTFPQNKGILSQALGNLFPQYVGLRHCVWKQAKGIHSSIYSMSASGTLHYEKWSKIRVILRRNYEKCLFEKVFLIVHLFDWLHFNWKVWEYEKWNWKIFSGRKLSSSYSAYRF